VPLLVLFPGEKDEKITYNILFLCAIACALPWERGRNYCCIFCFFMPSLVLFPVCKEKGFYVVKTGYKYQISSQKFIFNPLYDINIQSSFSARILFFLLGSPTS
jgi:hypothetical protein